MSTISQQHPVYTDAFTEEERKAHLQDDSAAWRAVTGILLTIVSIGACLAVFTVLICM